MEAVRFQQSHSAVVSSDLVFSQRPLGGSLLFDRERPQQFQHLGQRAHASRPFRLLD